MAANSRSRRVPLRLPTPSGVEQPALFTLHHAVRVMIMAAVASFLLGAKVRPSSRQQRRSRANARHPITN